MEPTPPGPLPHEVEQRLAALTALAGTPRTAAVEQLYRDFPKHAGALAARLAPDHSHVVTGGEARASLAERLRTLAQRGPGSLRYELHGEVARGGMGVILRAFDQDLGRSLAMKVILGPDEASGESIDPQVLERFVEEAQITGQLDHPGVVPVHELGLDDRGRVYFTMRLVRGRTAQEVFALARERADGWTPTRALEVLLKVCDTLAYAHSKRVVHRDLKPSNVMVGKYGEVYVMDWGLAKVLGQADPRDLRIQPESTLVRVRTDRSKEGESDPDTALRTMDGAIVGTPCYMPPEQANGHVEDVGIRSDVYTAGAMLYTLLTGTQPYVRPGSKTSPYMVLEWVRHGPPAPVHKLDPKAPAELVAICERAMARQLADRYATMEALADDLRAYLEGRVVRAYRTGARAELVSWVRRNRGMALGVAAAALALLLGGVWALAYARQADRARNDARLAQEHAERERGRADGARNEAEAEQQKAIEALAAAQAEAQLREEAESDLRQERWDLKRTVDALNRLLTEHTQHRRRLEAELAGLRAARRDPQVELSSFRAFEQLATVDRFLEASLAAPELSAATAMAGERDALITTANRTGGATAGQWITLLRAAASLAERDAAGARELLAQPLGAFPHEEGRNRMLAIAHWQLGDWGAAISAHGAASLRRDSVATHASISWENRNQFELIHLLLDLADTHADTSVAKISAANYAACLTGSPRLLSAASMLTPLWHGFLQAAADESRAVPELAAHAQRRQGRLGAALMVLGTDAQDATLQVAIRLERARCWLAAHRPVQALAALHDGGRHGCVFLPQVRQYAELEARGYAMLGEFGPAEQSLAAAIAATPAVDTDTLARLACDRALMLRDLGRAEDALASMLGSRLPATGGDYGALSPRARHLVAELAMQLGRRDVLAALVAANRTPPGPAKPEARLQASLSSISLALASGDSAAAMRESEQVRSMASAITNPLVRARCQVLLGQLASARGDSTAAQRELARAAECMQQWLTEYGRFRGDAVSLAETDALAVMSASVVDSLARVAAAENPIDLASAWRVLETFQDPVMAASGTRSTVMSALGEEATQYETARACWLEGLCADETGLSKEQLEQIRRVPVVSAGDLTRIEQRLRAKSAPLLGLLLPGGPSLMEIRARLVQGTCIVVFGVGRAHAVAFVAAAEGSELIAIDLPARFGEATDPETKQQQAEAIMAPVLRGRLLREVASWQRLLVAPVGPLHALPLEFVVAREQDATLLAKVTVTRVPSAAAWFNLAEQPWRRRSADRSAAVFVGGEATAPELPEWWQGVLAAFPSPGTARVLAGDAANVQALGKHAAKATCLALSLPLQHSGTGGFAALQIPAGEAIPGVIAEQAVTLQSLRDLDTRADLAIVHVAGGPAAGRHEAEALAGFVRGLWARGCRTVVTVQSFQPLAEATPLVAAVVEATVRGEDPVTAWSRAALQAIERGVPSARLCGVQLWSSP